MGGIVDAIFGGSAKDAAREQTAATQQAMQEYKKGVKEAKEEINPLFDSAGQKRLNRYQQAMDFMGGSMQPSIDAITQGNMNAQQMLAGSMPQMQNAILGLPVDYSGMSPQGLNVDIAGFLGGMPQLFNQADFSGGGGGSPDIGVPSPNTGNRNGDPFGVVGNPDQPLPAGVGMGIGGLLGGSVQNGMLSNGGIPFGGREWNLPSFGNGSNIGRQDTPFGIFTQRK